MNGQFALSNEPLRQTPRRIESNPKTRQQVLFAGLDCLPGQLDLFPTDGYEPEVGDSLESTASVQKPSPG